MSKTDDEFRKVMTAAISAARKIHADPQITARGKFRSLNRASAA
jgi:hypothetical protein